jgi:hypothetical protein
MIVTAVVALTAALLVNGSRAVTPQRPMLVTLNGVAGVRPGMQVAEVNRRWGTHIRPIGTVYCRSALFTREQTKGVAYFDSRGFGAVSFSAGARTSAGIGTGSSQQQLRKAYAGLRREPDKYVPGASNYFLDRKTAPHWSLRFDVSPRHRVTQLWFGNEMTQLVEGCS